MKEITLYIHKKCSTCQNAINFLKNLNKKNSVIIKDITVTPPSVEELRRMLEFQGGNVKKLFNTSGVIYREMELSKKLPIIPLDETLKLLSENGMLVKRPFLLSKQFGLIGFNKSTWNSLLA